MNPSLHSPRRRPRSRTGVALLVTLLMLSLITIIAVAFLGTMTWESSASRRNYENQKARSIAMLGMNTAVAQLRSALGTWDNPYQNFSAAIPTYYWSVSPGILTRWSYSAATPITNYPLFSQGSTNLVNLNAVAGDGTYPIGGGANPPNISVYWSNVLKDPRAAASVSNPIIGRYAFWIDDENAKVNINTADGTLKYTTNSLGLGTPSEVDLQVLQQGGANLTKPMASNIVYVARTTGFNSPREILRATSSSPDLYTNNNFSVTTWGRSPEINIFGESKISLAPVSPPGGTGVLQSKDRHGFLRTNNITGQALTEIYPTPGQLPLFKMKDPTYAVYPGATWTNGWRPIVSAQETVNESGAGHQYQGDRFGFEVGLIAKYLSGTNAVGLPFAWPVFPYPSGSATTTGTTGLIGKYSWRQLDALSFQIVDIAGKATTPETMNVDTLTPTVNWGVYSVPYVYRGILSQQLVPGVGRTAKVNELLIQASVTGKNGTPGTQTYTPPQLKMAIYMEFFLPAGFGGVDLLNLNNGLPPATAVASGNYELGASSGNTAYVGSLNLLDMASATNSNVYPNPVTSNFQSVIPRASFQPYYATQPNGYWQDTLLRNDAGIDFSGMRNDLADPDQVRAAAYHSYLTNDTPAHNTFWTANTKYPGSGALSGTYTPLFRMWSLSQTTGTTPPGKAAWYPGQYRALINRFPTTPYAMTATATSVSFSGGVVVNGTVSTYSDPDPTPLEGAVRAIGGTTNINSGFVSSGWCDYDNESMSSLAWAVPPAQTNQTTMVSNPTETVQSRMMKSVIPVNFTMAVPASAAGGTSATYHAEVTDPLVNKFPGDWITNSTSGSFGTLPVNGANNGWSSYYNGQNAAATTSTYKDPDSFWMPTLDPTIPRSARFPNIGYLQYLRTGVIPDDETVSIDLQHGTPFRCLNFNADNDASQMGTAVSPFRSSGYYYPDWAILDLFTLPSTLLPYGGPYGYYSYNTTTGVNTWMNGTIMTGNATNMYNYGTWGGSTPGRINPNGAVIYTTNVNTPTPGITRTLPLQALVHGLYVNQTIATGQSAGTATANAPTFSGGTQVNDTSIAQAIATYISTYGPLREPAEICNIPSVSANAAVGFDANHNNPTRNDLVRQVVGNLTTQSNVFSVWVEGQSIQKSKANNNPANQGIYESGDDISSTARCHFVVERYLDMGADGTVGNSIATAGTPVDSAAHTNAIVDGDAIIGTYDDPVIATYHPSNPRYLYRVVFAEEIRN